MGHTLVDPDTAYRRLQERLDRMPTRVPDSPAFQRILRLLFTADEAELAAQIPTMGSLAQVAKRTGRTEAELDPIVTDLARRGLVMDFRHRGRRYFMLPPVVIGFFEFTFMRTRDEATLAELARLFDSYMHDDDRFKRSVFEGRTQIGRSLVREEALPEGIADHVEVLDWERAGSIVESASMHAVSLCACRHKAGHLGTDCGRELRTCLTLNQSAATLVRSGNAEQITRPKLWPSSSRAKKPAWRRPRTTSGSGSRTSATAAAAAAG